MRIRHVYCLDNPPALHVTADGKETLCFHPCSISSEDYDAKNAAVCKICEDEAAKHYIAKTDTEIKHIAKELWAGQIFCDRQCRTPQDVMSVFMVLALSGPEIIENMKNNEIDFIYEFMSAAGPRSVNGYPIFMSCRYLDKEDVQRMFKEHERICEFFGEDKNAGEEKDQKGRHRNCGDINVNMALPPKTSRRGGA